MSPSAPVSRGAQIAMLVMLAVCVAQVVFWMYDEVKFTREVRQWRDGVLNQRVDLAREMLSNGQGLEQVRQRFPDLVVDEKNGAVSVPAAQRALTHEAVDGRVRRFLSEGTFFLATLLVAGYVVWRALSQRVRYARLQANFLAAVTHELKSPLASIRLSTETLLLRDPDRDKREDKLRRVLSDLDRLERLVGNILEARRLDEGGAREDRRRVSLAELVEEMAPEFEVSMVQASLALRLEMEDPGAVIADPAGVQSIVRNLMDNAIKAMVRGEGEELVVRCDVVGGRVQLDVIDDGVGFPAEEAGRLFDRFYRVGDELRRDSTGTGLGLDLVMRCASRDGARVEAHSDGPGRGARFTVSWPRPKGAV